MGIWRARGNNVQVANVLDLPKKLLETLWSSAHSFCLTPVYSTICWLIIIYVYFSCFDRRQMIFFGSSFCSLLFFVAVYLPSSLHKCTSMDTAYFLLKRNDNVVRTKSGCWITAFLSLHKSCYLTAVWGHSTKHWLFCSWLSYWLQAFTNCWVYSLPSADLLMVQPVPCSRAAECKTPIVPAMQIKLAVNP